MVAGMAARKAKVRDAAAKPGAAVAITAREEERLAALDAEFGYPVGFFQELYEIIVPQAHDSERLAALDAEFGFSVGFSRDLYEFGIQDAGSTRDLAVRVEKVRRHFFTSDGSDANYVYDLPGVIERGEMYADAGFGKDSQASYTGDFKGNAAVDLNADAAALGLPPEIAREALKKAAVDYARTITGRAKESPRLKWETHRLPDENPAAFAWRAYAAEAKAGTLHRGVIHAEDAELHRRLNSWLRSHPMPEGIDIPTKPEWNSRQIAAGKAQQAPRPRTDEQRLYDTAVNRRYRARHA